MRKGNVAKINVSFFVLKKASDPTRIKVSQSRQQLPAGSPESRKFFPPHRGRPGAVFNGGGGNPSDPDEIIAASGRVGGILLDRDGGIACNGGEHPDQGGFLLMQVSAASIIPVDQIA